MGSQTLPDSTATRQRTDARVVLIEAGSPGLNIYSHVAMGRGVPLLATVVRDAGYDVRGFVEDVSGMDSIDWDLVATADVIGFSAITCTIPRTAELAERARALNPGAVIVFGGPEPTCAPERSLDAGADYVLRGEAEHTFIDFLGSLHAGNEELAKIPGLTWREGGETMSGPSPRQLTREELDALPLVDRSLVFHANETSVTTVWRSRGCGQGCDFCEVREIWPKHVVRSEQRTVEELMRAQADGFPASFLIDDNAAVDKRTFKSFLREVASHGYIGTLVTQIRADSVLRSDGRLDRELLRLLKDAATVTTVCIGVESADDEDLEQIHKRIDSSRMAKALRAMRRSGLLVHGMFIAFAGDTLDVVRRNGAYARKYVTSLQYLAETPLPGTDATRRHTRNGAVMFASLKELKWFDGMHVVLRPAKMTPSQMQEAIAREYRRFYSLRRIIAAALAGVFVRNRFMTSAQRAYLRGLDGWRRVREWAWFQAQYRFAPAAFIAVGRRRIREFMHDPDYAGYLERLGTMGSEDGLDVS